MPTDTFFNLSEDKRTELVSVLLEEFSAKEYLSVSVNRIVEKAGISKGSFYQYFEDKKDSYLYLVRLAVDEKIAFHRTLSQKEDLDLFSRLRWKMAQGLKFQFSSPDLARVLYRAATESLPFKAETISQIRTMSEQNFYREVQAAQAAGEIRDDVDPGLAVFMLMSVFNELGEYIIDRFDIPTDRLVNVGGEVFGEQEVQNLLGSVISVLEDGLKNRGSGENG